jgi:hypothetical protein
VWYCVNEIRYLLIGIMGRGKLMINIQYSRSPSESGFITKCFCFILFYIEKYFESSALLPLTADIDPQCSVRILLLNVFECIMQ